LLGECAALRHHIVKLKLYDPNVVVIIVGNCRGNFAIRFIGRFWCAQNSD
jgi:hypothetical protein